MERKEAGIRNRSKGVGTTSDNDIGSACTDKVASQRNGNRTGSASVTHVRHDATGMAGFCHLGGNCGNGHLRNFVGILTAAVVFFDAEDSTHAATDNDAYAATVGKVTETCIVQGFFHSLDAELGGAVLFVRTFDIVQCITMHFGSQVRIAVLGIERCCLVNTGDRIQGVFPGFFNIIAYGTNDAKARNNTTTVIRCHRFSKQFSNNKKNSIKPCSFQ